MKPDAEGNWLYQFDNLDVVDDAFEYLMSKAQKGEKGQYFTPRYVIDMLLLCHAFAVFSSFY